MPLTRHEASSREGRSLLSGNVYRRFLTVKQMAKRYGASRATSDSFLVAIRRLGFTARIENRANNRVREVVWNDLKWLSANNGGGAGGGGLSIASPRPPFQAGLTLPGRGRAVPDVSAQASDFPGWPVVLAGNWVVDGGTSASAFAVLSADQRAARRPAVGPVDGLLSALRRRAPDALFDVTSGSNGYERNVPARRARRGYDLASGLGVPRFDRLAAALPAPGQ